LSDHPTPLCSLIIRAYNEEAHIGRLLSGVMQQTVTDVEIILVDSGSTDATVAIARQYPVKVVALRPEEFSFGRALNLGCRAARGEFLVFASAHVYPIYQDWLEQLLAPFAEADVVLSYGRQRGAPYSRYAERQVFEKWYPARSELRQRHPFANNANCAIRRYAWEALPYDEALTGLEDVDWAKRALAEGGALAYVAEAEVVHVHDESAAQIYRRYWREALALKSILPEERLPLHECALLLGRNVIADAYHAWHDGEPLWRLGEIVQYRLMQFAGTYRGLHHKGPVTNQTKERFYYPKPLARRPVVAAEKQAAEEVSRPLVRYAAGPREA
jgi:glycosyltransferase involved in cell wall biosynthesis